MQQRQRDTEAKQKLELERHKQTEENNRKKIEESKRVRLIRTGHKQEDGDRKKRH